MCGWLLVLMIAPFVIYCYLAFAAFQIGSYHVGLLWVAFSADPARNRSGLVW